MRDEVLAIHEPTWAAIAEVLDLQRRGVTFNREQAAERVGLAARSPASVSSPLVAVLPLFGLLTHRAGGFLSFLFGGTSLAAFAEAVRVAAGNPRVSAILLHVDSPGGEVTGTPEAADAVFAARQRKRVVAAVDGLGASAAFWIASQAHEIIASPSSQIGSIGIIASHTEISRAEEAAGRRTTLVTSGRRKAEGNPFEPLDQEARAFLQSRVDTAGAMFTSAVARGRGVPEARVRGAEFGEGRAFFAAEAVRRGLANRVDTIQDVITREVRAVRSTADFARQQAEYDRALAWWLTLKANGIDAPRPTPPISDEAALLKLRLAEHGL